MDEETVACLAACVGLEIDPAYMADVTLNFARLMAQAQLLMQTELLTETEPAPVFRA